MKVRINKRTRTINTTMPAKVLDAIWAVLRCTTRFSFEFGVGPWGLSDPQRIKVGCPLETEGLLCRRLDELKEEGP